MIYFKVASLKWIRCQIDYLSTIIVSQALGTEAKMNIKMSSIAKIIQWKLYRAKTRKRWKVSRQRDEDVRISLNYPMISSWTRLRSSITLKRIFRLLLNRIWEWMEEERWNELKYLHELVRGGRTRNTNLIRNFAEKNKSPFFFCYPFKMYLEKKGKS